MMVVASTIKCYLIYQICLLKCALHSSKMLLLADLQKNDIKKRFLILQLYHHVDILVEFECLSQASFVCSLSFYHPWNSPDLLCVLVIVIQSCHKLGIILVLKVLAQSISLENTSLAPGMGNSYGRRLYNYPYVPRNRNHAYFVCEYYKVVHHQDQLSSK